MPHSNLQVELLAPAGGIEAGFAAFQHGADAIYLGLKKFSARAEAENFSLEEVDEITAYAHSLQPRRRVFVTINTLVKQEELPELVEDVARLAAIGVDAIILQDLGVYRLLRRYFPTLEIHGSTQMAVHNHAGAATLDHLGFARVVLARELTMEEVHDVTATAGIETEVFIHGALCYAYSGLCLFSAQTLSRSGNRGKCAYSCRDSFQSDDAPTTLRDGNPVKRLPNQGFPFSMKDLALPDHLPFLRSAGVSCFKIEGRKKSPLYVATTTEYYRKLLDGKMTDAERPAVEADLQTVFSRPWTKLFVQSHKDKEVADRDTVGHRGTLIGKIEGIQGGGTRQARLRFRSDRALEVHDGLQIDLPVLGKPFGFAVDRLWIVPDRGRGKARSVLTAPANATVEVALPPEHPRLEVGLPIYCSSSQDVKRRYKVVRPKAGQFRLRHPISIRVQVSANELVLTGQCTQPIPGTNDALPPSAVRLAGDFAPARDAAAMEQTIRSVFEKLGDTRLTLAELTIDDAANRFVPVSLLNKARRELTHQLEATWDAAIAGRTRAVLAEVTPRRHASPAATSPAHFRWSLKVDRLRFLDAFEPSDWENLDELVVDVARDHPTLLVERLDQLAVTLGRDRIRLALPALTRKWEERGMQQKIKMLRDRGWQKWEAANLSAWTYLGLDPNAENQPVDLATDWSVYVVNRLAAEQLLSMGVTRFCLSPEDGLRNVQSLLKEYGERAVVIVHQDTPLFVAESCAYANLIGGCPGKANCKFESMTMVSSHGERVTALDYHCRTIVLNQGPYSLSTRLKDLKRAGATSLRADFVYRAYEPQEVATRWRIIRSGQPIPGGHFANFERGML